MRYALTLLLLLPTLAHGHKAPSGWQYPSGCCNGQDCHPVACGLVHSLDDGGATFLGMRFGRDQVKFSGDSQCHVCIGYSQKGVTPMQNDSHPRCIFLVPTTGLPSPHYAEISATALHALDLQ